MSTQTDPSTQLTIKVPKTLRDAFSKACQQQDTTASREIRAFMREYLKRHGQKDLEL